MLAITNLKPVDVERIYRLLETEGLLWRKEYANFVTQLKKTIKAQKELDAQKNKPLNPCFVDKLWKK